MEQKYGMLKSHLEGQEERLRENISDTAVLFFSF